MLMGMDRAGEVLLVTLVTLGKDVRDGNRAGQVPDVDGVGGLSHHGDESHEAEGDEISRRDVA